MPPTIHLHLGAHKTASTALQENLSANRTYLRRRGVCYLPLAELRSGLTAALNRALNDQAERRPSELAANDALEQYLSKLLFGADGRGVDYDFLIISDENVIGWPSSVLRGKALYADAARRLSALKSVLHGLPIKLFFSVRSYDTFLPSAYCEAFRHGNLVTFDSYLSQIGILDFSWVSVVEQMQGVFPGAPLTVWQYERFSSVTDRILSAMTTLGKLQVPFDAGRVVRASVPEKAIAIVMATRHLLTRSESRRLTAYLSEHFAFEERGSGVRIEDKALIRNLKARYDSDLLALKDRGCSFL